MLPPRDFSDPAQNAFEVTPADSDFAAGLQVRGFYVGVTGNVSVVTVRGNTVTFMGVPAGQVMPVSVKQIRATGTTASFIVALY